jgi:hypothetical protein
VMLNGIQMAWSEVRKSPQSWVKKKVIYPIKEQHQEYYLLWLTLSYIALSFSISTCEESKFIMAERKNQR